MTRMLFRLSLCFFLWLSASGASAEAVMVCAPPSCERPMAYEEPTLYGGAGAEKALMAASVVASWLIVSGFLLALGVAWRRPAPFWTRCDPKAQAAWSAIETHARSDWESARKDPELRSRLRRSGFFMMVAGILLASGLMRAERALSPALAGSTARLIDWSSAAPREKELLELSASGRVYEIALDGSRSSWGSWFASADRLILSKNGSERPAYALSRDQNASSYWAFEPADKRGRAPARVEARLKAPLNAPPSPQWMGKSDS